MSISKIFTLLLLFLLTGCSTIEQLQDLQVSLLKIESSQAVGLSPRFNVHLLVSNPNSQDLAIEGLTLRLDIAEQKILSGLSNQIPKLLAYSETPVEIQTSVNLFALLKLLSTLSLQPDNEIKYQLNTRIDPKGFIAFNLNKEGLLNETLLQGLSYQSR